RSAKRRVPAASRSSSAIMSQWSSIGTVVPAWSTVSTIRTGGIAARASGSRRKTAKRTRRSVYFGVSLRRAWLWGLLLLIVLGSAAVRIRLLDVPLDRDEGEYAWIGSLIVDGTA